MLYMLLLLSLILCCVAAIQHGYAQGAPSAITTPAPPPLPPSPVDTFRKILAMPLPEREKYLATLTPEKRQIVMLKLDEYQGLPAKDREVRLRELQVRVCVRQMIKMPPSNRVERLAVLAPPEREAVQVRLAEWDKLSPELQQEVLANEISIRNIARAPEHMVNPGLPPFPGQKELQADLDKWRGLSEPKRSEILAHFQYFFGDLTDSQRAKVMSKRPDMAKALDQINRLPKEQRERYIAGFQRLAALSPTELQRFLINASHWQKMTPEQRESWRALARKLGSAPMPPPIPGRSGAAIPAIPSSARAAADAPDRELSGP